VNEESLKPSILSSEKVACSDSPVVRRDIVMVRPLMGTGSGVLITKLGGCAQKENNAFFAMRQKRQASRIRLKVLRENKRGDEASDD
jgi:hypothetical protein